MFAILDKTPTTLGVISMGKKDNRKFKNLDKLIYLLLDHPEGLTKAEIARRLSVHRSTAAEYIDSLEGINAPVYEVSPNHFTINRDHYEVQISVDMHESLALHLASRLLTTRTDKHYPHAASALRKLGNALNKLAPLVSEHMKHSADVLDGEHRRKDSAFLEVLETLTQAWSRGLKIKITHEMADGQTFAYDFAPYFIEPYAIGRTMHVIGLREPPGEIRTFKIERIRTARLLDESYIIPESFDPSAYLKGAWGIWITEGETQEVVLRFSPQVAKRVQETQWHYTQTTDSQSDGFVLWKAQIAEWREMLPWVRGWGADCEVVEPKKFRKRLEREARKLAGLYEVMEAEKLLVAHVREKDGEIQSVWEHLNGVSELAGQFAGKIGLKESGELLGLLHDLGKASQEFQNYISSATGLVEKNTAEWVNYKAKKGKVDHSSAGAQVLYQRLSEKGQKGQIAAQALSLCIASHHSGLIDCLSPDGKNNFKRRIEKTEEQTHADESFLKLPKIAKILSDFLSQDTVEEQIFNKLNSLKTSPESHDTLNFKRGLLIRYLLSCILDADRLNTADFEFPSNARIRNYGEYHSWDTLIQRLNNKIQELDEKEEKNEVDELRNHVSQSCFDFSTKPRGIYQLTVPTGGGKTFSSLRFALNHAKHHKLDRIFYIVPYTSIIDQNAAVVRKILEDKDDDGNYLNKVVLEHHSNLIQEDDETQHQSWQIKKRQKLLSENWDAPLVFTTQVQFLETLFGSGTKSARRMHQLARSVIIFDEIQTIPIHTVHIFNTALRFLVHSCGSTAVLCTATQPLLDKVEPDTRALPIDGKIIENEKELFKKLKRVEVFDERKLGNGWSDEETAKLTRKELREKGSVLIIVNTKKSALSLYRAIVERSDAEVYHLSTKMCPVHRLKVLASIKKKLDEKEPVICVSTQLIEAGVDIDFGVVIRYLAGLDSITQAAGRCNRNGEREIGNVWIVNPENENIDKLTDIKKGVKVAERILGEFKNDKLGLDAMTRYYKYYFYNRKAEMPYNIGASSSVGREDNLFNLLSRNTTAAQRDTSEMGSSPTFLFKQSFQTASREFHAIDSPTRGVIVPYGEAGKEIVNDLCGAFDLEKEYKLIKKAQRYSVNLFPHEFQRMVKEEAIREVQEGAGIYYLDNQYYSEEFGWSDEVVLEMKTPIY